MISIVIPAYNEEKRVEKAILEAVRYCRERGLEGDIIVVDDGSTDKTAALAMKNEGIKCIQNGQNRGKGYSVRRGFNEARGKIILFTDADLSTSIDQADRLIDKLNEGYDIAIASRALPDSRINKHQPPHRLILGVAFGYIVRALFDMRLKDTQCGFKAFKREAVLSLLPDLKIDGFTFDVELLLLAQHRGLKIAEIPVAWEDKRGSKLVPSRDFYRIVRELMEIRRNLKRSGI